MRIKRKFSNSLRPRRVRLARNVRAGHMMALGVLNVLLQSCAGGSGAPPGGGTSGVPTTSVTVSWTSPTTRTDGTPLSNLAGFRIRYGTVPGRFSKAITVANPGLTTYVVAGLPPGTYYFVVTAFDTTGLESSFSAPVITKEIN
jgi:hypothetical protein